MTRSVGQWINSNLSALAEALSSVHVPELKNKPFYFSGIDEGSAQANVRRFILSTGWLQLKDFLSGEWRYNIDIVIGGVDGG